MWLRLVLDPTSEDCDVTIAELVGSCAASNLSIQHFSTILYYRITSLFYPMITCCRWGRTFCHNEGFYKKNCYIYIYSYTCIQFWISILWSHVEGTVSDMVESGREMGRYITIHGIFYVFRFIRHQCRENFHVHYPDSEHSYIMTQWQVLTGMNYNDASYHSNNSNALIRK